MLYCSNLQPFWYQEPISWQTILPWIRRLRDGFRMIQVHYIYCALYFYYYYIGSMSDHQTLDPRGWRPPQSSAPLAWSNQPGTRCVGVAWPSLYHYLELIWRTGSNGCSDFHSYCESQIIYCLWPRSLLFCASIHEVATDKLPGLYIG